jgi:tetratricopeptide (TPR) repeat protein
VAATEAGIEQLLSRFSSNKRLPEVAYWVAQQLNQQNPARAVELSEYVARTYPNDEFALYSKVNTGVVQIFQDNDEGAEAIFSKVLSEYSRDPRLPEATLMMGQGYYDQAVLNRKQNSEAKINDYCRKAIAKWENAIETAPTSATAARAHWRLAVVHSQELGEHMKGIEHYQRLVDNWPDYEYAPQAQFFIGRYLEKLRDSDALPESEANQRIDEAYSKFIERYPNNDAVPIAALRLGKTKLKMKLWPDAILYLEKFIQEENGKAPPHVLTDVLRDLAYAYEHMNETTMAAEMRLLASKTAEPTADNTASRSMFHTGRSHYKQAVENKAKGRGEQSREYVYKAITVWERLIGEFPSSPEVAQAYYNLAICYGQFLADYHKSIGYFEKVIDNWPNSGRANVARYYVGKYYEILKRTGAIPASEANARIEEAYQAVVEHNPQSSAGRAAMLRLGGLSLQSRRWVDATKYLELFLLNDRGQSPKLVIDALYYLGQAYEEMGEFATARENYEVFMELAGVAYPDDSRRKILATKIKMMKGEDR